MQLLAPDAERPRHVLHINTDDFFAALVRQRDPSLGERPVVVGHLLNRGSVVSASYAARAAGVHPGLTMQQAARRAPDALLVQIDWAYARRASRELIRVLESYAPRVEASALDEAFVDYTGCERLLGTPLAAGRRLQREVKDRVGLDVSIGVAANKLVSRFASSAAKRHNLLDVLPGYEASFLAPQGVERLPSVGSELGRRLREMGVVTAGDLARFPVEVLEGVFGAAGRRLADEARGIDRSPVVPGTPRPCVEESETFEPDLLRWDDLEARLDLLCARLGAALSQRRSNTRRLILEVEHSDRVRVRRQAALVATNLDTRLFAAARQALAAACTRRVRVRRLVLQAWGLEPASMQLDLFVPDAEARLHRLAQAADRVRERYGDARALVRGRALPQVAGASNLRQRAIRGAILAVCGLWLAAGPAPAGTDRPAGRPAQPGWVLHERHTAPPDTAADTIRTYVTASRVRVSYPGGDAILDVGGEMLLLLDPSDRTYRRVPLAVWEASLRAALESSRTRGAAEAEPRFERAGQPVRLAGYLTDHFVLYARRQLLPGDEDFVEVQIWVARDLELPHGAYEAYQRLLVGLESIGLGGVVTRPPGVVLAAETRTRAGTGRGDGDLVERSAVFRVEQILLPDSLFSIPAGYAPADTAGE